MSEPVTQIITPVRLEYTVRAGATLTRFLGGLMEGRIVGQRAPDGKVYVPPRGACPVTGRPMTDVQVVALGGSLLRPEVMERHAWLEGMAAVVAEHVAGDGRLGLVSALPSIVDRELAGEMTFSGSMKDASVLVI